MLPHITFAAQSGTVSGGNSRVRIEKRVGDSSRAAKERITLEIVTDLVLLSEASAFVGTFSSQISRIAVEMHYFSRGFVPPFVSLDFAWCYGGFAEVPVTARGGGRLTYPC